MTTNENIQMYQGDTLELEVNDLPSDQDYFAVLAVQDEERNPVGPEVVVSTNYYSTIVFTLEPSLTDLFTVSDDKKSQNYYYGIKLCSKSSGMKRTVLLGKAQIGDLDVLTVFPRKVKGSV